MVRSEGLPDADPRYFRQRRARIHTGPGLVNFDTSLFKKLTITEALTLQFRAEAFNLFNHANFSYPNEIVFNGADISPSAGVLTQTSTTSRQLQFALKLLF